MSPYWTSWRNARCSACARTMSSADTAWVAAHVFGVVELFLREGGRHTGWNEAVRGVKKSGHLLVVFHAPCVAVAAQGRAANGFVRANPDNFCNKSGIEIQRFAKRTKRVYEPINEGDGCRTASTKSANQGQGPIRASSSSNQVVLGHTSTSSILTDGARIDPCLQGRAPARKR